MNMPDPRFVDTDGIPFLQRIAEALENPPQTITVSPDTVADDLDPTFAALAGACFSFADQLEQALNEPDQFLKAQALRNLVSRVRTLADKYAQSAAAEDYNRVMDSRIRKVSTDEPAPVELDDEPDVTDPKYRPKDAWKPPDS
jgi:hypothetical protein